MKLFWTVMGLLIALAAATLLWPSRPREASPEASAPTVTPLTTSQEPAGARTQPQPGSDLTTPPSASTSAAPDVEPVRTIADMSAPELADRLRAEAARIAAEQHKGAYEAPSITQAPPPPSPSLDELLNLETPSNPRADSAPQPTQPTAAAPVADPAQSDAVSEIAPMRQRAGEDGWTILDERFPIRGSGTQEDPYEVSWELLVSASETYQPRLGKTRLPERIAMLHGKHVRVTGYVAFPIMAMEQNELLSMRNMWDGCCIGTPPTPYDAIEVRLQKAATGQDRFTAFGSLEGLFKVDPYVKGNWLLGLYLMEDAKLTKTKDIEMPKPTHGPLPGF